MADRTITRTIPEPTDATDGVQIVVAREGDQPSAFVTRRGAAGLRAQRADGRDAELSFGATPAERLGERGAGERVAAAADERVRRMLGR
jgi:hypothetical protein